MHISLEEAQAVLENPELQAALGGALVGLGIGIIILMLVLGLAMYVYYSLAFMTIANKTNTPNGWMAWVPILNILLMVNIAGKPSWWLLLFFVPLVNFVIMIIVLMAMAEARNKPSWMGLLFFVPVINIAMPAIFAWTD